jgi:hypothetical protein
MLSIPTGDSDSSHPEDMKYSEGWKQLKTLAYGRTYILAI